MSKKEVNNIINSRIRNVFAGIITILLGSTAIYIISAWTRVFSWSNLFVHLGIISGFVVFTFGIMFGVMLCLAE